MESFDKLFAGSHSELYFIPVCLKNTSAQNFGTFINGEFLGSINQSAQRPITCP